MSEIISIKEHKESDPKYFKDIDIDFITNTLKNKITLNVKPNGMFTVSATKNVGSVGLPSGDYIISVFSKVNNLNFFKMLAYSEIIPHKFLDIILKAKAGQTLVDLLSEIFIKTTNEVIATGLYRNYVIIQEETSSIKGRLMIVQNIRSSKFSKAKPWCEYDELSFDNIENRSILFCTHILLSIVSDQELKKRLVTIRNLLLSQGVSFVPVQRYEVDSIIFQRLNKKYEDVIEMCKFILYWRWYHNFTESQVPIPAFFVNMNTLFEKFVYQVLRKELHGYRVTYQEINPDLLRKIRNYDLIEKSVNAVTIKPDIIIEGKNKKLVIDTKYESEPDSSDFYQATAYSLVHNCNTLLLFPEIFRELSDGFEIQSNVVPLSKNHRIHIKTIKFVDEDDFINQIKRRILDAVFSIL